MADKRMFSKTIVDSDAFLDMPLSTQALYFHLSMRADDDGFLNNANKIRRTVGASEDDLKLLIAKKFVIEFEDGIIVIKHWRMNNYLRNDRHKPTVYQEELSMLEIKENGAYSLKNDFGIPSDYQLETQNSIDKNRVDKSSIDKNRYIVDSSKEIVDHLNFILNTNYKHTTKKTQDCIKARLNEGFTVDDFKTVIDKKAKEWMGTDMEKYLRPETLFGNKFEGYLNQTTTKRDNPSGNGRRNLLQELMDA